MLGKRLLVVAVLLPLGVAAIILGDLWYFAAIALILGLAAPEFSRLFEPRRARNLSLLFRLRWLRLGAQPDNTGCHGLSSGRI